MAVLEHRQECVASWTYIPGEEVIVCQGCRQRYASTPERRFAADYEQILTLHMHGMAEEGVALLARQVRVRPRWRA